MKAKRLVRVHTGRTTFLFFEANGNGDSGRIARAIAMCKGIKEVFLTSGKYAFVAHQDNTVNLSPKKLKRITGNAKMHTAENHFVYRKI